VVSTGTVNALFRIGDHLCARLPRQAARVDDLEKEWRWLPILAPHLSVPVPTVVEKGRPGHGYPFPWAVYRWLPGRPYADEFVADERQAAGDLARFVLGLRAVEAPADAPAGGRAPLGRVDEVTRRAIDAAGDDIDGPAATAAWEGALEAPVWDGTPVWIHADLLRPNLLVDAGRLAAVIDFGSSGIGDPATDLIAAWSVFGPAGRRVFTAALDVDEGTRNRARGIALHQAAMIIPYYRRTNPAFVTLARRTVDQVLADIGAGA
jgi:aminoglycoside phosphotransferase (APT) family kinase protein